MISEALKRTYIRAIEGNLTKTMMPLFVLTMLSSGPMTAPAMERKLSESSKKVFIGNVRPTVNDLINNGCVREGDLFVTNRVVINKPFEITDDGRELLRRLKREYIYLNRLIHAFIKGKNAEDIESETNV